QQLALEFGAAHGSRDAGGHGPRGREMRPLLDQRPLTEYHSPPENGRPRPPAWIAEEGFHLPRLDQVRPFPGVAGAKKHFARLEASLAHAPSLGFLAAAGRTISG